MEEFAAVELAAVELATVELATVELAVSLDELFVSISEVLFAASSG